MYQFLVIWILLFLWWHQRQRQRDPCIVCHNQTFSIFLYPSIYLDKENKKNISSVLPILLVHHVWTCINNNNITIKQGKFNRKWSNQMNPTTVCRVIKQPFAVVMLRIIIVVRFFFAALPIPLPKYWHKNKFNIMCIRRKCVGREEEEEDAYNTYYGYFANVIWLPWKWTW